MTEDASTRSSYMIWDGVAALLRTGVDGPQVLHFNRDAGWEPAGGSALSAITGLGDDAWSCGEWSTDVSLAEARQFALEHGWELFGATGEPSRIRRR